MPRIRTTTGRSSEYSTTGTQPFTWTVLCTIENYRFTRFSCQLPQINPLGLYLNVYRIIHRHMSTLCRIIVTTTTRRMKVNKIFIVIRLVTRRHAWWRTPSGGVLWLVHMAIRVCWSNWRSCGGFRSYQRCVFFVEVGDSWGEGGYSWEQRYDVVSRWSMLLLIYHQPDVATRFGASRVTKYCIFARRHLGGMGRYGLGEMLRWI